MKKLILAVLTLVVLGVVAVAPLAAQEQPSSEAGEKAAKPEKAAKKAGGWSMKAEKLSGAISLVDKEKKLVIVDAGGIPYDFKVSGGTKIKVGGKKAKLDALQTGKQASVSFVAMRTGNAAKSIEVSE
jgi:hypothetical protein